MSGKMGSYSKLKSAAGEWQFYGGHLDDFETFEVGADISLRQEPDPHWPGQVFLGDDVYEARSEGGDTWGADKACWFVIKDGFIGEPFELKNYGDRNRLRIEHGIYPPDPGLWTEKEWADYAIRRYQDEQCKQIRDMGRAHWTESQRIGVAGSDYTRSVLKEAGMGRIIMGLAQPKPAPTFGERIQEVLERAAKDLAVPPRRDTAVEDLRKMLSRPGLKKGKGL